MLHPVLEALVPFPEARAAVAQELEKLVQSKSRKIQRRLGNRRQLKNESTIDEFGNKK
jgi:hypothetical protein